MDEKEIQKMTKPELVKFIKDTIEEIDFIQKGYRESTEIINEIREIKDQLDQNNFPEKINAIHSQSSEAFDKIKKLHSILFDNDKGNKSFFDEITKMKIDLQNTIVENKEHIKEIKNKFEEHNEKYKDFYAKIEKELLSGATSVSLSKDFNDKVAQYKKARRIWEFANICAVLAMIVYFGCLALTLGDKEPLFYFIPHLPVVSFSVWLIILMGNRRAENLKLEESYKHKVAMAKSFTGYKKSIEELELSSDDKTLLTKLMTDLLAAIKKDSSEFLSTKGEKHPIVEAINPSKP